MVSTPEKLKKDLAAENAARLYVFHGEESYLKSNSVKQLEKLCSGFFPEFDLVKLDGDTITADALRDAVESLPMGGERKLVEVIDYPLFGAGPLKEELPSMLANLPDYLTLVFVFEALEYKEDKRLSIYKTVDKYGEIIEFKRAENAKLIKWLRRHFADDFGKTISDRDCEKMIFICGGLMNNLITEVEKIASGTKGDTVTAEDIEKLASRSLDAKTYELTNHISKGDCKKALLCLRDLLDMKYEAVSVSGSIAKHYRALYAAKLGLSREELMKYIGLKPYPADMVMQACGRFRLSKLREALKLCLETDVALKSSMSDDRRTLELLLLRLAA